MPDRLGEREIERERERFVSTRNARKSGRNSKGGRFQRFRKVRCKFEFN